MTEDLKFNNAGNADQAAVFWKWFTDNEHTFRKLEKNNSEQALAFLDELIHQMNPFNTWLKALAGPYNNDKYELIITADGDISLFVKVEELVEAAPAVDKWVITAHKPALGFDGISIDLYGKEFSTRTTNFYPVINDDYPDEVNIVITHNEYDKEQDNQFQAGGMIYLENGLGEINTATKVDHYETGPEPPPEDGIEIIPIAKLHDYLAWREKEFVEKYELMHAQRPEESFNLLEAEDKQGKLMLATMDVSFREWAFKPAYPWLVQVEISYKGNEKGLPTQQQFQDLQNIENEITALLSAHNKVHYTGHRTYDNNRDIFFYASEYKIVSQVLHRYLESLQWDYEIDFFMRKDKYWHTMELYFDAPED